MLLDLDGFASTEFDRIGCKDFVRPAGSKSLSEFRLLNVSETLFTTGRKFGTDSKIKNTLDTTNVR